MKTLKFTLVSTNVLILSIILFTVLVCLISCEKKNDDIPSNIPTCIVEKIWKIKSENVWNPPAHIWQYHYDGQIVYYIPSHCCDIPGILVDENCNPLCSPDGGLSGNGDGNCPDFFDKRTDEKLIWKDQRTYP